MLRVLSCIQSEHDLRLVALAVVMCTLGFAVTARVFRNALAESESAHEWLVLAGIAGGASIWCTHFIAVLAFLPELPANYEPVATLLSLLSAIASTSVGLLIASRTHRFPAPEMGGAIIGLGAGLMHSIGMRAYSVAGDLVLDFHYLAAALVVGVVLGALAMGVLVRATTLGREIAGITLLVCCIGALHFTAMAALTVIPALAGDVTARGFSSGIVALGIFMVGTLVTATGLVAYSIDRRSKARSLQDLHSASRLDDLTGLPNRTALNEHLVSAIKQARTQGDEVLVVLVNLGRFNEVNEVLGVKGGDEVLAQVAQSMRRAADGVSFIARLSGTHFAIVQRATSGSSQDLCTELANTISAALSRPIVIGERSIKVCFHVGVAAFPKHGRDCQELMANADIALEQAHDALGNGICVFDETIDKLIRRRRSLAQDLRHALDLGQLELHFQPQYAVRSLSIVGYEGLLRWRHPDHGLVSPAEFIPLAEETGLIIPIGEWVLHEGCRIAATWPDTIKVALNLSPLQFHNDRLCETICDALRIGGLAASRLELEITESTLVANTAKVLNDLTAIKDMGIAIALDDFGTGYSSMATLASFPFDKIKLDKSLLDLQRPQERSQAIVHALMQLSRAFGVATLVEGVETEEQLAFIRSEGCDEVQGFLLGRPMPAAEITARFAARIASPSLVPALAGEVAFAR